jgi:hypothetical protein
MQPATGQPPSSLTAGEKRLLAAVASLPDDDPEILGRVLARLRVWEPPSAADSGSSYTTLPCELQPRRPLPLRTPGASLNWTSTRQDARG